MARTELQVQWSTNNSQSISSGSNATSDAVTFSSDMKAASVQFKANNNGTPASGDTVDFYVLYTNGDPDGTGGDEYDDAEVAAIAMQLDTNTVDPAKVTVPLLAAAKGCKIYASSNASSNGITVSATITELS